MSVEEIMNADVTGKDLVEFANLTGDRLSKSLKSAQIRSIFTEARRVEAEWSLSEEGAMRRLMMLKPKLAYQAKRNPDVEPLRAILTEAIEEVAKAPAGAEREKKMGRFMDLFEAILAYHRFHGGN